MSGCVDTGGAGRQETWPISPQVLCNSPRWASVSVEMATEVGCACLSMDLIVIKTFYLLKGSEFHPKGRVLGSREACPATSHPLRTFCVVTIGELRGTHQSCRGWCSGCAQGWIQGDRDGGAMLQ